MSTRLLKKHRYGLPLSARVIVILQANGITPESLTTRTIQQLTALGLSEPEARNALLVAQKAEQS
jgi:hypothetical protein